MTPPLPPSRVDHAARRLLRGDERAGRVDGEDALQALGRDIHELGGLLDDAGIVEEGIEPAELGIRGLEEAGDVLGLGDVGLDGDRLAAGLADVGDDGLRSRLVGGVVDDDVLAALRREPRGGRADAAAATGDEEDLGARRAHALPPLAVLAK